MSNNFKWKLNRMVFKKGAKERKKQSSSGPEKIGLEYTKWSLRNLTFLENFRRQIKMSSNRVMKKREKNPYIYHISFLAQNRDGEFRISKSKCIQWHSLPCCYFLLYSYLRKCNNNSPIQTGEMWMNLEKKLCSIANPVRSSFQLSYLRICCKTIDGESNKCT